MFGIRPLAVLLGFVGLMISRQMAPYLIGIVLFIAVAVAAVLMWSGSPVRFIFVDGMRVVIVDFLCWVRTDTVYCSV